MILTKTVAPSARILNMVPIARLRRDGGTQQRLKTDPATVAVYVEAMLLGAELPPAKAFYDGTDFWLVDGFHTTEALLEIGLDEVNCEVQAGTQRDAQWASFSVNRTHGLQRSNEDKRHIVVMALSDPEWSKFSSRVIAEHCGVGHTTVDRMRVQLAHVPADVDSGSVVGGDGKTYSQRAKRALAPEVAAADPIPPEPIQPVPRAHIQPVEVPADPMAASALAEDDGRLTPAEAQAEIDRENERTTDRLIELERLFAADDTKAKLFDMVRMRDNAVNQQAAISSRAAALDKMNKFLARIVQRCGKAVGESDNEKVAAAVEALARKGAAK